jgi:hypothetical protein
VPIQRSGEEALGGSQIAPFAEPEFDRVSNAVNGTVEISPLPTHLDVRFVDMPTPADGPLAPVEALEQFRRVANGLSVDGRMIDGEAPLGHRLFKISQAQAISEIPADAEQDHGTIEMSALEHHASPPLGASAQHSRGTDNKCLRQIRIMLMCGSYAA